MSQLAKNFKNDLKAASGMRLPWWAILCGVICSAFSAALFDHFGRLDLFLPMFNSVGMLGVIITLKWKLRTYAWFWITIAIMAALHVPLILLTPWTLKWIPAFVVAVVDLADLCVMLFILSVVGGFVAERNPVSSVGSTGSR